MALGSWRNRIDGVDDATAKDINDVANAVVEAEGAIKDIYGKLLKNIPVPSEKDNFVYAKTKDENGYKDRLIYATEYAEKNAELMADSFPIRGEKAELYGANVGEDNTVEGFSLESADRDVLINAGTLRTELSKKETELKAYTDKKVIEGTLLDFKEDNTSAYIKNLPSLYGEKAFLKSIGGASGFVKNPANTGNYCDPKKDVAIGTYITERGGIFTLRIPAGEHAGTIASINVSVDAAGDEETSLYMRVLVGSLNSVIEFYDADEGLLGTSIGRYGGDFTNLTIEQTIESESDIYCVFEIRAERNSLYRDNGVSAPYYIWGEAKVEKVESEGANLFNAKNIKSAVISVNEDGSQILLPLATSGNGNTTTLSK